MIQTPPGPRQTRTVLLNLIHKCLNPKGPEQTATLRCPRVSVVSPTSSVCQPAWTRLSSQLCRVDRPSPPPAPSTPPPPTPNHRQRQVKTDVAYVSAPSPPTPPAPLPTAFRAATSCAALAYTRSHAHQARSARRRPNTSSVPPVKVLPCPVTSRWCITD